MGIYGSRQNYRLRKKGYINSSTIAVNNVLYYYTNLTISILEAILIPTRLSVDITVNIKMGLILNVNGFGAFSAIKPSVFKNYFS